MIAVSVVFSIPFVLAAFLPVEHVFYYKIRLLLAEPSLRHRGFTYPNPTQGLNISYRMAIVGTYMTVV
jgi:hypothetical protein